MSNSKHTDDQSLQSYLEGRDGLSETYRGLPDEEPPRALDDLILARAKEAASPGKKPDTAKPAKIFPGFSAPGYSIAASLLLFMVISTMLWRRDELQAPLSEPSADSTFSPTVAVRLAEPAARSPEAPAPAAAAEGLAADAGTQIAANRQAVPRAQEESREFAEYRELADEDGAGVQVIVTGSRIVAGASELAPRADTQAQVNGAERDEVLVSSADAINDQPVLGQEFRLSAESWAEEIFYLRKEAADANALVDEESTLFRQRFPDADLDALIESHEAAAGE